VQAHGIYTRTAGGPPTGIDLLHQPLDIVDPPIVSKVEIRKEGKIGRVYYPAPS